ncbi:MAG: GYD domain-containing protein [Gemmatimonadales bacterium]|nr:MAG: GYD domain-containing protein [Gemmatimonadales bacterium]
MATYITLLNQTEQGIKNVKGIPERVLASRQAVEKLGGRLHGYRLTLGEYDAVVTVELPDDEAYATFVLNLAAQGNVRTTTLKAFSEEESFRIFGNLA